MDHLIANQLQSRWENINRVSDQLSKSTSDSTQKPSQRKKTDRYGCVNYLPSLEEEANDLETMKRMQDEMANINAKDGHDQVTNRNIGKQLEQTLFATTANKCRK